MACVSLDESSPYVEGQVYYACKENNVKKLEILQKEGIIIISAITNGFITAIENGNIDVTKWILEHYGDSIDIFAMTLANSVYKKSKNNLFIKFWEDL